MRKAERRLLLAGSAGPERIAAYPDPNDARWFEPLHVRDQRGARDRIAAQLVAGADVVVAPTWLTHRRALLPLGETRSVRAWTTAAVQVAREAIDVGLERRAEALADAPDDDIRRARPTPLVAATLPALNEDPEPGWGHLLPREAAAERDYRDQAGLLADVEPDLILVEGQRTEVEARTAIGEATATGLRVWAALTAPALASTDLGVWLGWCHDASLERVLLPSAPSAALSDIDLPFGGTVHDGAQVPAWLEAGADVIAQLDGASAAALKPLRTAMDDHERAGLEAVRNAERRWRDHVEQAAALAPGGAAAWLGPAPQAPLPGGFDWHVVDGAEVRHLPAGRYRLVVCTEPPKGPDLDGPGLGSLLERGGILAAPFAGPTRDSAGLRLLLLDEETEPPLAIYRLER